MMSTPKTFCISADRERRAGNSDITRFPPYEMANIGSAEPREYAPAIITSSRDTLRVAARVKTEARIGPTQGVHINPREMPRIIPPRNPFRLSPPVGMKRAMILSMNDCKPAEKRANPNSCLLYTSEPWKHLHLELQMLWGLA